MRGLVLLFSSFHVYLMGFWRFFGVQPLINQLTFFQGIMETFAGLGYTAGPIIGSVLYEYGGFQLPFFVLGVLLIFATAVSYFLIENIDDEPTDDSMGMLSMLRIPVIWLMVFAVIICAISLSFFDPTLAGHLSQVFFLNLRRNFFLIL